MLASIFKHAACAVALALASVGNPAGAAESPDRVWNDVAETAIARTAQTPRTLPLAFRTLALDAAALDAVLAQAPRERDVAAANSTVRLSLPLADGRYGEFRIVESPVMEPALAAKFPQIRTWLGQGIDDPTATLRMDLTPQGFHAQIIGWEGTTYVDPYQPGDIDHYIAYRKRDAQESGPRPVCEVTGQELPKDAPNFQKKGLAAKVSSGTSLRTYRIAVAATGEYTAFHGGTVPLALAAVVTTINRVTGIYERDLSVRLTLVANNNLIIYTNAATDPYANTSGDLAANQSNITAVIGSANFDIGHLVGTGGGGVAGLGVVCNNSQKARGLTGSSSPVGDAFDVDYVAHEVGHQFGGNHTFNSTADNCGGGNRNAGTAYEVGSGITIQAYAGICAPDNVQNNSSDYFHRGSLNEMLAFTTNPATGASCGTATATGNTPPTVSTTASYTIPARTPFALTATGSDANGDTLTYIWEEFDLGAAITGTLVDNGASPILRNYNPGTSPTRTIPALASILSGTNGNQWELLPTTTRTMNFRVTARDNRAGGGGTNEAPVALSVVNTGSPFAVTAPNTAVSWDAAVPQTVSWDVAGTNANGINAANVRILLSLDGGTSFPLTLATAEPNDGSATVTLTGATPTTQARIKVQGENNVFFDISNANFTITGSGPATGVFVQSGGNTAVTEGGATDSYTVALSAAPSGTVTVTLGSDPQLTRSPATLTFTTGNWSTPQTVTVAAVDDAVFEGPHTGAISHNANGGGYNNVPLGTITVAISDNDASLAYTSAAVVGGNNVIDPNECNDVNITLSNGGAGPATGVSAVLSTSTPNITITQPTAAFPDIPAGQSRTSSTPFQVSSAAGLVCPGSINLTLTVSYAGGGSAVLPFVLSAGTQALNYTFASATGATIPAGGVLVGNSQADDLVTDLAVPAGFNFSIYGTPVSGGTVLRASTNGALQFVSSGGSAEYANAALPNAGTANNLGSFPAAAAVLFPYWDDIDTGAPAVTGGGIYQQLTGTAPNRKWIVEWRGEHVSQAGTGITVKFAIEFSENSDQFAYLYETASGGTGANGASATIGVQSATTGTRFTQHSFNSAVVSAGLRLTATRATSCSPGAGPCAVGTPGVTVTQSGGSTNVTEGGASDSYTVVLNTQPSASVTIALTPDAQVAVSPASLTFTTGNWNVAQTVTVNAVNDSIVEGTHSGSIAMSATGGGYTGVSISPVTVTITDNDNATLTTAPLVQAEGNSGSTTFQFTLQLSGQVAGGFSVNYATRNDTALAGQDYTTATGTVSFDASANPSRNVSVAVTGDTVPEATERFFLDLSASNPGVLLSPAAVSADIVNDDLSADIAVTNARNAGSTLPGQAVSYTVTVQNLSNVVAVPDTSFSYTLGAELGSISWTCSASGGASCPASGNGAPAHSIALPAGASVSYTINATIGAGVTAGTTISTTASATVVAPYGDPTSANNTATVQFVVAGEGVFANGFE